METPILETTRQEIRKDLECPVCLEFPHSSPIFQCTKGHIVCKNCAPKLKHCPICRSPERIRALAIEKILAKIFPEVTKEVKIDPNLERLLRLQFERIVHAQICQEHNEEDSKNGLQIQDCFWPDCQIIKDILSQVQNCKDSRQVLNHCKNCSRSDCPICPPFLRVFINK